MTNKQESMKIGRLTGKRIAVIGAGSGIGAATVERLCREGARVVAADINLKGVEHVAAKLCSEELEVYPTYIDLAEQDSVLQAFAFVEDTLAGLDGVHINAADLGVIMQDSDALNVDLAVFDRTLGVNLRGHLLCTRAALPLLETAGGGSIVYTSSGACDSGEPVRPSYAVSKSGLNALMRHVASAWGAKGITANCVAPGFTLTPEMEASGQLSEELLQFMRAQIPGTRLGRPSDIAGVVAMLLSTDGNWINGQVIHVNGGALMH